MDRYTDLLQYIVKETVLWDQNFSFRLRIRYFLKSFFPDPILFVEHIFITENN